MKLLCSVKTLNFNLRLLYNTVHALCGVMMSINQKHFIFHRASLQSHIPAAPLVVLLVGRSMDTLQQYSLRLYRIASTVQLSLRWGIAWLGLFGLLRVCCDGHRGAVGSRCWGRSLACVARGPLGPAGLMLSSGEWSSPCRSPPCWWG